MFLIECPTECVYFDPSGIKQCDCNHSTSLSTSSQCPPLLDCNNHCEFGFKKDEKGCDVCKCTECHKQCSDGYMIDNKGVSICKCQREYHLYIILTFINMATWLTSTMLNLNTSFLFLHL